MSADPTKVSARAKKRGLPQLGTLGPVPPGAIKAFQPLVEYPGFFVEGLLWRKRDPVPEKRPPQRFLGRLELQFGHSNHL